MRTWKSVFFAFCLVGAFCTKAEAADDLPPPGKAHTLSIDPLAGFRVGLAAGVSYAGPLGFAYDSLHTPGSPAFGGERTDKRTTFWLAPSADFFVVDHVSIGGLFELSVRSTSVEYRPNANTTQTIDLPTTTSFTLLPRVGYLAPVGERMAIWPRLGLGYGSRQVATTNIQSTSKETISGLLISADAPFLYRMTEAWYFRVAPEITYSPGTRSIAQGATTTSTDATYFSFSLSGGVGVFLSL